MVIGWHDQLRPGMALREIVKQTIDALTHLDVDRLEDLERCCAELNGQLLQVDCTDESVTTLDDADFHHRFELDLLDARAEIQLFARVLQETRANLALVTRLQAIRLRSVTNYASSSSLFNSWDLHGRGLDYGNN